MGTLGQKCLTSGVHFSGMFSAGSERSEVSGRGASGRGASVSAVSARLTQAVGAVDGEAHEDDVGVWIRERPQTIVVLLTRRIPQR